MFQCKFWGLFLKIIKKLFVELIDTYFGSLMNVVIYTDSPDAPKNLQIPKYDKRSCDLTWDKPDFDGGNPISGMERLINRRLWYFSWKKYPEY